MLFCTSCFYKLFIEKKICVFMFCIHVHPHAATTSTNHSSSITTCKYNQSGFFSEILYIHAINVDPHYISNIFCTRAPAATRELNASEIIGIVSAIIAFLTLVVTILALIVAIKCCKKWWGRCWEQCCEKCTKGE